jgi:hypothetical protein
MTEVLAETITSQSMEEDLSIQLGSLQRPPLRVDPGLLAKAKSLRGVMSYLLRTVCNEKWNQRPFLEDSHETP